jgi:hypothetical protein
MLASPTSFSARGIEAPARRCESHRSCRSQGRPRRTERLRQVELFRTDSRRGAPGLRERRIPGLRGRSRTSRRKRSRRPRRRSISFRTGIASSARSSARSPRRDGCRTDPAGQGETLAHLITGYDDVGGYSARARAATLLAGLGFPASVHEESGRWLLGRLADAAQSRAGSDVPLGPAAPRRAHQSPRPRCRAVARGLAHALSRNVAAHHARPRFSRRRGRRDRPHRRAES